MVRYWNPDMEKLDQNSIKELENRKLRAMVRGQFYPYHPYYRKLLRSLNVDIAGLNGIEDLSKIPFTAEEDVSANPGYFVLTLPEDATRRQGPLATRMQSIFSANENSRPVKKILEEYQPVMMFETIGTSTAPYNVYLSSYDIEIFKELCGRGSMCAGLSHGDRAMNLFSPSQHLEFWHAHYSTSITMKICSMFTGYSSPSIMLDAIERQGITTISGNPMDVYYLSRAASITGKSIGDIRKIILSGRGPDEKLKKRLSENLSKAGSSADIIELYSLTECRQSMAECIQGSGFHTYPDVHIWECIDEKTGEPVGAGERGELVFTSIDGRGSTFLRYRTGDIASGGILYETCEHCGRTVPRIMGPIKKARKQPVCDVQGIYGKLMDIDGILYAKVTPASQNIKKAIIRVNIDGSIKAETIEGMIKSTLGNDKDIIIKVEENL
jgi:phenylacetate-coenzyme A ligase PaaK-like adenylate-forming protein